jgi:uncharacterized metal-binding protein
MDREGIAEMSCIAGVGGDVPSLVRVAKSGRPIVAIDGCALRCAQSCLKRHGVTPSLHFTLSDFEIKKTFHQDLSTEFPKDLQEDIAKAYSELAKKLKIPEAQLDVAVRSSATAEDLPDASFAGQQESYLNIRGQYQLLEAIKKAVASLFTNRAISYRVDKHFDHFKIALSVAVQKMGRSDRGASGVMFTLDTESGFKDVVLINAAFGLGEYVVKGVGSGIMKSIQTGDTKNWMDRVYRRHHWRLWNLAEIWCDQHSRHHESYWLLPWLLGRRADNGFIICILFSFKSWP